ncbi:MAG TPA: alcohol dehydrogenase catalytic domain-containing protein [Actinomycetota bacterium]|nr:alcohol dehydrogenase catalytic domain-containing protein [Actinomycetota bacterium]
MTIQALELFRSAPRYLTARAVGQRVPGLVSGPLAPLRFVNKREPELPGPDWARVRPLLSGICGSDLATISGQSSFYFSPLVSMPFVPGHEVVGELVDDVDGLAAGDRVVLEPVLSCAARGIEPMCSSCTEGRFGRCDRITTGHVSAGLQTGFCADTGGGWSRMFVAHRSQLHPVPDRVSDRRAVLVEPLACAVHSALRASVRANADVLVIGAGTVGILTLVALKELTRAGSVVVVAKHRRQREWAESFGATDVVSPGEAIDEVRRSTRALKLKPERGSPYLLGGVDIAIDCVGSKGSLDLGLRTTRAGGRVVLAGIPVAGVDLTPLWFRELELVGAYTGGVEERGRGTRAKGSSNADGTSAFDIATRIAAETPLDGIVGATYPLRRWRSAIDHALGAGRLGTLKVAFDLRAE